MSKAQITKGESIAIDIPLAAHTGKIRVKNRPSIFEYGLPFASRREAFSQRNYVEWQIGYDATLDKTDKLAETTLGNFRFSAYNGETKALYELSEYMFYMVKWGFVAKDELGSLIRDVENIKPDDLVENHTSCQIKRTHPRELAINDILFLESKIEYPLLIHRFGVYEVIAEIVVREKQYAIGTQAMLYFCFPITELHSNTPLLGRTATKKRNSSICLQQGQFQDNS